MRRKAMVLGFAIAAVLTVFFAVRAILFAVFWMDPERGLHPVEPWMTPRYIARTYDLPREALQEVLHLTPGETPRVPLEKLAAQRGIPLETLMAEIEAIIAARPPK